MSPDRLPNLIMPGVQKSGTTYLAALLAQHPEIFVPHIKEPAHFLAATFPEVRMHNGEVRRYAYGKRDAYEALYDTAESATWRLDASTGYFAQPKVAETIRATCGPGKVICMLRHPAERAHSAFVYNRQLGIETAPTLEAAVAAETALRKDAVVSTPYLETGRYADHIAVWDALYGAENVLVLLFEDMRADAEAVARQVFEFLDLVPVPLDMDVEQNVSHRPATGWRGKVQKAINGATRDTRLFGGVRRMIPPATRHALRNGVLKVLRPKPGTQRPDPLMPEDRAWLMEIFEDDIAALSQRLNRDLSQWQAR